MARSTLPEASCRWLSSYSRGRQSVTSFRGVKSKAMIVHTGVPQGLKLSLLLFSFYLADMPRPTEPVKWICYADDITVWASGVKVPELEHKVNTYLTERSPFLRVNSLLIPTPKSSVTLFTPDPAQANTHPKIKILRMGIGLKIKIGFQRLPPARGGTAQKIIHLANWSQLIHPGPASSLTKVFFGVE